MERAISRILIRVFEYPVAVLFVAISLLSAGSSLAGDGAAGAHRKCEFCHITEGSGDKDGLLPDHERWTTAASPGKSFFENKEIGSSKLCLSCHDGLLAGETGGLRKEEERGAFIDLKRSHPVSMDYRSGSLLTSGRLNPVTTLTPLKLFKGKVECATCHDIHKSSHLRMSKRDLCFRCHDV